MERQALETKVFRGVARRRGALLAFFKKAPLVAEGSMLLHPFARPWDFPAQQTTSQTLFF
jgi:hypothetical protein